MTLHPFYLFSLCNDLNQFYHFMVGMSILSSLYDKMDCATPPPLRIISAEAMKGELSRLQRRARCIVAHPDRLQGDRAAGQDQRRVPRTGRVRAEVYARPSGTATTACPPSSAVHRRSWCPAWRSRRGSALPAHTSWGTSSSATSAV